MSNPVAHTIQLSRNPRNSARLWATSVAVYNFCAQIGSMTGSSTHQSDDYSVTSLSESEPLLIGLACFRIALYVLVKAYHV